MFGKRRIGYALCVDAEVQNPADRPVTAKDSTVDESTVDESTDEPATAPQDPVELVGTYHDEPAWNSWFSKGVSDVAADGADDDLGNDDLAAEPATGRRGLAASPRRRPPRASGVGFPLASRPLINPHLRSDPRFRIWVTRIVVCIIIFIPIKLVADWQYGFTAAVIYASADIVFRSRTTGITPTSVRVTSAQRRTGRRLRVLRTAGYMALHARTIPETKSVIDHVVVGPSGIFTVDSQVMDARLPIKTFGGMLYHGPNSQEEKIDHARFEAQSAAKLIAVELGQRIRVRPVIVLYGPTVPWVIMRIKGVDILDGRHVSTYFRRQSRATAGRHIDAAQVALVYSAATHALPSLY
jgi:hypothetical protein